MVLTIATRKIGVREACFADYEAIAALESAHGLASKPREEWRRLWTANPSYRRSTSHWPIGWVLEDGDQVVGSSSNIPLPYVFEGQDLLAASGRGWVVKHQYRGYAPLLANEYFSQQHVDLFINTTVNDKAAEVFSTFGSFRVPLGDWQSAAFAITGYREFAESALRIKQVPWPRVFSYPTGVALWVKDNFAGNRIPDSDIEVKLAYDFDQRFDAFWQRLRQQSGKLLAVRSREVLQWHFGAALERNEIWILTVGNPDCLDAYAVLQRRDEPQFGLKRVRIIDFQCLERQDEYCAAIIRGAYEECRAKGIHVLEQVGCKLQKTRLFEEAARFRRRLPSWSFFYLAKDPDLGARLSQPASWAPSSYDGDSSL